MLRWARERASLSIDALAHKISVSAHVLEACERGEQQLTFRQAQLLASRTHIPFGILFLPQPPEFRLPVPDYRSRIDPSYQVPSLELFDVLHDAQRKQDWFRDYALKHDWERLEFVGSSPSSTPEQIATSIRRELHLAVDYADQFKRWEDTLQFLISAAEEARILVIRNGIVGNNTHRQLDVDEFRGFVLVDDMAPLVFLNGKDAKSAQMFTLIHELAHLWIGKSGLTDAPMALRSIDHPVERICNQVAAEVLAPQEIFLTSWDRHNALVENLDKLAKQLKISRLVVISRALDLELISWDERNRFWEEEWDQIRARGEIKSSGGDFYPTLRFRNGRLLSEAILRAVWSGEALYRDAFHLLGLKNSNSLRKYAVSLGVSK